MKPCFPHCLILAAAMLSLLECILGAEEAVPLPRAHAHNDYHHKRPLLDALANGFCSVEADVFLVNGKLLVAHSRFELHKERTLEKLYLEPLARRVKANSGRVYKTKAPFWLMIDFKNDGAATYAMLNKLLARYQFMLTRFTGESTRQGAVTIVISGDRPRATMAGDTERRAGYDGRLSDLDAKVSPRFMPWISDSWRSHFGWRGKGGLPAEEKAKLESIVSSAHANGQLVRFWAAPDNPAGWAALYDAGVDFINTDDLEGLSQFLWEREAQAKE